MKPDKPIEIAANVLMAVAPCRRLDNLGVFKLVCAFTSAGLLPSDLTFEIADAFAATAPETTLPLDGPWLAVWQLYTQRSKS